MQRDAMGNIYNHMGQLVYGAGSPEAMTLIQGGNAGPAQAPYMQPGVGAQRGSMAPFPIAQPMPAVHQTDWSDLSRAAAQGMITFRSVPTGVPALPIPIGDNLQLRRLFVPIPALSGNSNGVAYTSSITFPEIGYLDKITASVRGSSLTEPRDDFTVYFSRTNGDNFTTSAVLGSTICGTAQRPYQITPQGFRFARGESLAYTITPLDDDLEIYITLHYVSIFGPANFAWPESPASPQVG
jgi:hypothetical protein